MGVLRLAFDNRKAKREKKKRTWENGYFLWKLRRVVVHSAKFIENKNNIYMYS